MDLDLVADFLVLIQEMHYSRAAARLHLTPAALTKRVQRLERQLGVPLVERGPTGVLGATAAGRRFASAAEPLLAHAKAARESAMAEPARHALRVGVPAGYAAVLQDSGMSAIARHVRRTFPEARLIRHDVPFSELTHCMSERRVDVLWNCAPVHHPAVASIPLALTSPRIGVLCARHPLADARTMDAADFSKLPLLYNPAIPDEWMNQFWLADLRPRHEARLIEADAVTSPQALRRTAHGDAAMVGFAQISAILGPRLRAVTLTGAAPVLFYAAYRRADRRGAVHALLEAFQTFGRHLLQTPARPG
jgi:DNA-binding transcriptional LysR family regulator